MSDDWNVGAASTRMATAEVRRRMLEAATDQAMRNGLTLGFEHIRLDRVMAQAGVSKTSVRRIWPTKEAFFAEFLPTLSRPLSGIGSAYDQQTLEIAQGVFQQYEDLLGTKEGRVAVLHEAVRQAVDQNFGAMVGDPHWAAFSALAATARNAPDPSIRDAVVPVITEVDAEFVQVMASFYDQMLPYVKARFRTGVTSMHLAAAGAAVVEGLVTRSKLNPQLAGPRLPGPAIDGGQTDWSLASIAFLGIALQMIEFED